MFMKLLFKNNTNLTMLSRALATYSQGQIAGKYNHHSLREYFYHLDHQGQTIVKLKISRRVTKVLFEFEIDLIFNFDRFVFNKKKEQRFLDTFFKNLKINDTTRYEKEFPFFSDCGAERNYLKCDDLPFVLTSLDTNCSLAQLNQLSSINWSVYFDPNNLFHHEKSGRLYYLFEDKQVILDVPKTDDTIQNQGINKIRKQYSKLPCKVGLVKSAVGIELLKTLKPIEETDKEALKTGNKFKLEYKNKSYILNSNKSDKVYDMIKKFSMLDQHKNSI